MSKPDTKPEIKIICNIVPGKASEHQKHLWMLVWRRLISELKQQQAQDEAEK